MIVLKNITDEEHKDELKGMLVDHYKEVYGHEWVDSYLELLDESIENIQKKNMEFIEINKSVSTSMSKIITFCNQLDVYIKNKLEPFNISINTSYQKIFKKKQKINE